jgi:predicted TIM-barrel enzyme
VTNRGKILDLWRRKRMDGLTLSGGPAGPDFLTISNEDRLPLRRAKGIAGLLPIGDANALVLEGARELMERAPFAPVLAGVCATDPLRLMDKYLLEMKGTGVAGVQNLPSVGVFDGGFRAILEGSELGYAREVEFMKLAVRLDLVTAAMVFGPQDARAMAEAGVDLIVVHPGVRPRAPREDQARRAVECAQAAREIRKDLLVIAYGDADTVPRDVPGLDGIQIE